MWDIFYFEIEMVCWDYGIKVERWVWLFGNVVLSLDLMFVGVGRVGFGNDFGWEIGC